MVARQPRLDVDIAYLLKNKDVYGMKKPRSQNWLRPYCFFLLLQYRKHKKIFRGAHMISI